VDDAYKALGLSPDATNSDIKRAYRKLAMEYHPDRNQSPEAQAKIKEVNEAYSILNDSDKKAEHDARLHMGNSAGFDPNSFFDQFFSGGHMRGFEEFFTHGNRTKNRNDYASSHTRVRSETTISLEEAKSGATRRFVLNNAEYDIHIPPGVSHGDVTKVILDDTFELQMYIKLAPHRIFRREGNDLHTRITVPLSIALTGGDVRAPIVGGEISLTIPPGTSSHTKLRVTGGGLVSGNIAGNAYYEVKINIPHLHSGVDVVIQQLLENQSDV